MKDDMNNFDMEKLERTVKLLRELDTLLDSVVPKLEFVEKFGANAILPQLPDRLLERGEVLEILKIGTVALNRLINSGDLTKLYIANSTSAKFLLSEIEQIIANATAGKKGQNSTES